MGKIVTAVLLVVAAVALVVFAPEIAGAIGFMVGGFAGIGAAAMATLTASIIGMGLSLGMSAATMIFRKTPNLGQSLADRLSLNADTTAPRRIIFGHTAAPTDLRFKENYGATPPDRMSLVVAHSSHPLTTVESVTLDDVKVWQNGIGLIESKFRKGLEEVDPKLVGTAANARPVGTGNYWNRTCTFTGCSYSVITYKLDKQKVWASGLPSKITTIVEGCPVYDPRLDSTVGGNGPMRWNDQSTWAYRSNGVDIGRNPALAILTYIIGWKINGVQAWGMGVPITRVDLENFKLYANICEEHVQTASGGTVQRYTADGVFSTNDSHMTIINSLSLCMGTTILTDVDGVYQFIEGYDDTLTTPYAFTSDDIIAQGVWNPSLTARERFNRVAGKFADPAQLYALTDWGEVAVDPLADGIIRTQSVDFGSVGRAETCQRIAKQMVVKSKYGGVYTALFGWRGFGVSVGSLVTLSGVNGWNNKLFRVIAQDETYDLTYQMSLREESPEIYEWDSSEEKPLPNDILSSQFDPVVAEDVIGLTINAEAINGTNSVDTIYINVNWTPAESLRTTSIEIQSTVKNGIIWTTEAERFDPTVGTFRFGAGVNGAGVDVRARYRMDNGAYGEWVTAGLDSTPVSTVNNWTFINDPNGTKPADNATNTRDPNTPLGEGGETVGSVVDTVTAHSGKIDDLIVKVDDLTADGGGGGADAAAAAQSAAEAAQHASDASTSAQTAQTAQNNANTANTNAQAAVTAANQAKSDALDYKTAAEAAAAQALQRSDSAAAAQTAAQTAASNASTSANNASTSATTATGAATAAGQSAGAASTSATNASASATTAGQKATIATDQATAATTAKSDAQTYASNASTSATNAASSASTATQQAGLATTAKTDAQTAATSATGSASTATSKADAASQSATAAANSATAAGTSAGSAQTYSNNASASASTAQGYANNASTSAGVVATTATNILQQVASTLPQDFEQDGTFWSALYAGAPTRAQLPANSTYAYPAVGNYLTINAIAGNTAGANTDIANLGAIPIVANRIYTITANYTVVTVATGGIATAQVLSIPLSATYAYTQGTVVSQAITATGNFTVSLTTTGNAMLAAGNGTGVMFRGLFRVGQVAGVSGAVVQLNNLVVDDVTDANNAAASAVAAATSASNASTSATAAGQSATAAQASATTATTAAGSAQTYASSASTSATNAAGSATSAATSSGVSASSATAAQAAAQATFPTTFETGTQFFGGDTGSANPVNVSTATSSDGLPVLQTANLNAYSYVSWEQAMQYQPGRTYRVTAKVRSTSSTTGTCQLRISVYDKPTGGTRAGVASSPTPTLTSAWQTFTYIAAPTVAGAYVRPEIVLNFPVVNGVVQQLALLSLEDITESTTATTQATAAATSASNAATSATSAGTSATAANTSATNASTSAGQANTYANNASTSATSAQGYANTASTQAGLASTSATNAGNSATAAGNSATTATTQASNASASASAASTAALQAISVVANSLPSDFSQQGTFWAASYTGAPAARGPLVASSVYSFPTVTGFGTVLQVAPGASTSVDTSEKGYLPIGAAGRRYRATVTYMMSNLGSGGTAQLQCYFIGLNSVYNNTYNPAQTVHTPTSTGTVYTVTCEADGDDLIAHSIVGVRTLARCLTPAANTTAVYQIISVQMEDITAQYAAANYATNALTSANAAAGSATSASGSANTATTQAGNSATSATASSNSASAALASAAAASTSASISASVGTGSLNANPAFAAWSSTYPDNWTTWSGNAPTKAVGATSPNAVRMPAAVNVQQGISQVLSGLTPVNIGDWIVLEADILLNSGTLVGAGLLLQGQTGGNVTLSFAADKDTTDNVQGNGAVGSSYSYRKLIQVTGTGNTANRFYAMSHWTGFGAITAANDITFLRAAVRFANQAEIAAQRADANAATALANITSEAATRASETGALSTRVDSVNAYVNVNPNLIQNPTAANGYTGWTPSIVGLAGFDVQAGGGEGTYFHSNGTTGTANSWYGWYQDVPCYAGSIYTLQAQVYAGGLTSTALARSYMEFLTSAKAHISYSDGGAVKQIAGGTGWTPLVTTNQAPANCAFIRVWFDIGSTSAWSSTNVAWKRMKLEQGLQTQYTDDATARQLASSVSVSQGAIAGLQGKTEAWLDLNVQSGTGRAVAAIHADGVTGTSSIDLVANTINLSSTTDGQTYTTLASISGSTIALNGAVTIGGQTASTVASNAANPAAVVNANSTTINGGKITTKSIGADQINVNSLSAVSGVIGTLQSGVTGQRYVMTDSYYRWYDSNNVLRVEIGILS